MYNLEKIEGILQKKNGLVFGKYSSDEFKTLCAIMWNRHCERCGRPKEDYKFIDPAMKAKVEPMMIEV